MTVVARLSAAHLLRLVEAAGRLDAGFAALTDLNAARPMLLLHPLDEALDAGLVERVRVGCCRWRYAVTPRGLAVLRGEALPADAVAPAPAYYGPLRSPRRVTKKRPFRPSEGRKAT